VKVLVIGSGAREHALLLALSRDPVVTGLVCAPGNAGTTALAESRAVDSTDGDAVVALAREVRADLVVVGPEVPLVAGVADALRGAGIPCFGPSAAAARIEGSKSFAKQVMRDAGVATAAAEVFADAVACRSYLATVPPPYVVKADGLAAGKGVHVGRDLTVAQAFADDVLSASGGAAVVETFLDGPEVSLFALSDGRTVVPLLPAQDFKRVGDGDIGPNTGGMGAYAPLPWLPEGTVEQVRREVLAPVVQELARRGTPFVGLLYAGLAMTSSGPQVIEFNCRFGDPRDAGGPPAAGDAVGRAPARLRHRPARRGRSAELEGRRRGHRRGGRRGLPRQAGERRPDQRGPPPRRRAAAARRHPSGRRRRRVGRRAGPVGDGRRPRPAHRPRPGVRGGGGRRAPREPLAHRHRARRVEGRITVP
jgi:phosphoribosylamine--glycine ligase